MNKEKKELVDAAISTVLIVGVMLGNYISIRIRKDAPKPKPPIAQTNSPQTNSMRLRK